MATSEMEGEDAAALNVVGCQDVRKHIEVGHVVYEPCMPEYKEKTGILGALHQHPKRAARLADPRDVGENQRLFRRRCARRNASEGEKPHG